MNRFSTFIFNFIQKYKTFMAGRYGFDRLGIVLVVLYMLINGIGSMFKSRIIRWCSLILALLVLGFAVYRFLSKNIEKRHKEADFLENFLIRINWTDKMIKLRHSFKNLSLRFQFIRTHRFRKCPNCGEFLRLSKKRGKRKITCPVCQKKFTRFIFF